MATVTTAALDEGDHYMPDGIGSGAECYAGHDASRLEDIAFALVARMVRLEGWLSSRDLAGRRVMVADRVASPVWPPRACT
jgi:hypothetical protein